MTRSRSVSPVGASRFERPYTPPSHNNSAKNTPTTPVSSSNFGTHFSKPSYSSTYATRVNTDDFPTPPTSIDSLEQQACQIHDEPDAWFDDFRSDLSDVVGDECPDRATLAAVQDIHLYDASGNARPFGWLYDPARMVHQRQLLIFVRHFYCGACQAYLKALSESITMQDYFSIPVPTSIIVIGCGKPDLIPFYKAVTGCPFPIFAEPSRELFKKLGMTLSFNIGNKRPEYMKDISPAAWAAGQVTQIKASLKAEEEESRIRRRDILKGGHPMQIGGEFLFDEGQVVWCHRMKNYRNHAEVSVVRTLLELDE